ncbi:MAG: NAD(P)H-dependent oxidoreductase [Algisphaera sp.]
MPENPSSNSPVLLAFAGSLRVQSFNKALVRHAARAAEAAGARVTVLDLGELGLPLFNQDLEPDDVPAGVTLLREQLKAADGFLIASPEYNASVSAVLKNAIDWASRPVEGEPPREAFVGKVAAVMSATPSGLGGVRGLDHLRAILTNLQTLVLPLQVTLSAAHEKIKDGVLDEASGAKVDVLAQGLVASLA